MQLWLRNISQRQVISDVYNTHVTSDEDNAGL
jgi:hypothetical protein